MKHLQFRWQITTETMNRDSGFLCDKDTKMKTTEFDIDKIFIGTCIESHHFHCYMGTLGNILTSLIQGKLCKNKPKMADSCNAFPTETRKKPERNQTETREKLERHNRNIRERLERETENRQRIERGQRKTRERLKA